MMKFKTIVDAHQWFKNGDHPEDGSYPGPCGIQKLEGLIVRYYRHPSIPGHQQCRYCGHTMHDHGWIDEGNNSHRVCPGDWIITGIDGSHYTCKPDAFKKQYERVDDGKEKEKAQEA